jgi:DNA replication and repair protein RecF
VSLHLSRFRSFHFRNLQSDELHLHPQFNFFYGDNGQGKTNLLEAIYFLLTLRPLRPVRTRQLLAWDHQEASVQGDLTGNVTRTLQVRFTPRQRSLLLNGGPPLSLDDYFENTHVVSFTPEEIQLIRGAPELRRRFLDRAIFNTHLTYLQEVRQYLKLLSHRNALLKQTSFDETLLEVLNEQFVHSGARLVRRRMMLLASLQGHLQTAYARIFPTSEIKLGAEYSSTLGSLPKPAEFEDERELEGLLQQRFVEQLDKKKTRERERRTTLVGPHLDDLHFFFNGHPFKHAASQGQTRALVLALKIAEIQEVEEQTGHHPILILDDVAGELDPRHAAFLFGYLEETKSQVLLSTTSLDYISMRKKNLFPSFLINGGNVISNPA